jgi:plasmid stabilization system protein ParE
MTVLLSIPGGSNRHSIGDFPRHAIRTTREDSKEEPMPPGSKSKYTDKQKRQAEHIEEGTKKRGHSAKRAAQIGWATVNKQDGGGKQSGGGRGKARDTASSRGRRSSTRKGGRTAARKASGASAAR